MRKLKFFLLLCAFYLLSHQNSFTQVLTYDCPVSSESVTIESKSPDSILITVISKGMKSSMLVKKNDIDRINRFLSALLHANCFGEGAEEMLTVFSNMKEGSTRNIARAWAESAKSDSSKGLKEAVSTPEMYLCFSDSGKNCYSLKRFLCDKNCFRKPNKYNSVFNKNCSFIDSRSGKAITARYIAVYDKSDMSWTYLKLKNARGKEYIKIKKHIQPKANDEMYLMVIAKDSGYSFQTESEDFFLEYEESFAKSIENTILKKDSVKNEADSTSQPGATTDATKGLGTDVQNELVHKLISAEDALSILLSRYASMTMIEENYYSDLNCFRAKMRSNLGIRLFAFYDSITQRKLIEEAELLFKEIDSLIKTKGIQELLKNLNKINIASSIKFQYYLFISKQINAYKLYATQIQIPDKDLFRITIEQKNATGAVAETFKREFRVSSGFKIDFSAGGFLTGLSTPEFVAEEHFFKYKEATFAVNPNGTIDTTFTGNINDTTGKLVHSKNPRMNYAAGVLCHAYVRTGTFANAGLATGFLINNDGFQILAGGSVMFSIKKSRFAVSGGIAWGKQKTLSPTFENSVWQDNYRDGTLYNTAGELPKFSEISDVTTYYKWRTSWFFSLTYNFRSVNIRL
jgi:hypothetical protein